MANFYDDSKALKAIKKSEEIRKKITGTADKIENSQKHTRAMIKQSEKMEKNLQKSIPANDFKLSDDLKEALENAPIEKRTKKIKPQITIEHLTINMKNNEE